MSRWWLLALGLTGCAAKHFGPCNDTITCQAQQRERDREFARLVAEEPLAERLDVEEVSGVLHDRRRHVLYVTGPELLALELRTGRELWRNEHVKGALSRAGTWLAAAELTRAPATPGQRAQAGVTVHFIDVASVARPVRSCAIPLSVDPMANELSVEVFDRGGVPLVSWSSWWSYGGGTPPPRDMVDAGAKARGCGVVRVDPATCSSSAVSMASLLFDPPPQPCDVSPRYAMPAAVASSAPVMPAGADVAVRVLRLPDFVDRGITNFVLEVRDATGAVLWTRRIGEEVELPKVP